MKIRKTFYQILLGAALALSFLMPACAATATASRQKPQAATSMAIPRMVVAHWIAPMKYRETQTNAQMFRDEVRAAKEMGLDGFALNMFTGPQARGVLKAFIAAADGAGATNFKFFLSADMSMKFPPEEIVRTIQEYGDNPHYLKVKGKPLLSVIGGWGMGNDWWEHNVLKPLRDSGHEVTFIPYFDRGNPNGVPPSYDNWMKVLQKYPSVDGLFNFLMPGSVPFYTGDSNLGHHWWSTLEAEENLASALRASNKLFMAPFMPYYWAVCHPARQYMEHQGGRGMDSYWKSIIEKQQPVIVQIVTWNDYAESTYVQPTQIPVTKTPGIPSWPHLGYYELLKYYIAWFKYGKEPTITQDVVFAFHRTQPQDAQPTEENRYCKLGPVPENQKWGVVNDVIYLTTALTAPAKIVVTHDTNITSYDVPAGLNTTNIPFVPGSQTIKLERDGVLVLRMDDIEIDPTPKVYNYNVKTEYISTGGTKSKDWYPNDDWKHDFVADWFTL